MIAESSFNSKEISLIREKLQSVRQAIKDSLYTLPGRKTPIPLVGACYPGIWMEHNQDWYFLADIAPESAWEAVELFMENQKENGLFPVAVMTDGRIGYKQIQNIWPFARCAFEIAKKLNKGEKEFRAIYNAAEKFDRWLGQYRDHKNLGLVEMFCEYDTGHDNSPRVMDGGLPRNLPEGAENMPRVSCLPILAPDLSAMRYQARVALSEIAALLGEENNTAYWQEKAQTTKYAIKKYLYDEEDDFYYDVDSSGKFRKYRTEHLTRLYLNDVVEQGEFDRQYKRYFEDPQEFCTPFPFPAVSISDPSFVKDLPKNCWGSNTQALTALRATMWLPRYGRNDEKERLLKRWMRAFLDHDSLFPQELNPFTGEPIGDGVNYMPTLLLFKQAAELLLP